METGKFTRFNKLYSMKYLEQYVFEGFRRLMNHCEGISTCFHTICKVSLHLHCTAESKNSFMFQQEKYPLV